MLKTALITGSNKGIGFETARQLGLKGFRVFISGRNKSKLSDALNKLAHTNVQAEMLLMDVSDLNSIKSAASNFAKFGVKIDVLINNAAILLPEDTSILNNSHSILNTTVQTNCYGVLHVIREFLPYIMHGGRIVNMSSGGGSMTDPVGGWSPAYCVSKSMLNAITRQLANELKGENISVNAVCPGWVKTDMGGQGATRNIEKGAETPVWLASEASQELTGSFFRDKEQIPW